MKYSYLELVCILAIISLTAVAGALSGKPRERWKLETAAGNLASDFRLANNFITTRVNTRFEFRLSTTLPGILPPAEDGAFTEDIADTAILSLCGRVHTGFISPFRAHPAAAR